MTPSNQPAEPATASTHKRRPGRNASGPAPHSRSGAGFSLLEMLTVMAIIGIIAGFAVPAFTDVMKGNELKQTAEKIRNELVYARQTAIKENKPVVVHFYEFDDLTVPGDDREFRAMETFRRETSLPPESPGADTSARSLQLQPLSEVVRVPPRIKILGGSQFSTLLQSRANPFTRTQWNDLPRAIDAGGSVDTFYFEFRPDGSTNLAQISGVQSWHLTLVENLPTIGNSDLPANYITLQLDAINGNVRTYQPGF